MQSLAMEVGPLSPSSYLNLDMMGNSDDNNDGSNAIDLFKYYLDMSQMQQKEQPSTSSLSQQQQPATVSMADIEQFQSLFGGSNGNNGGLNETQGYLSPGQSQQTSLYPFADAATQHAPTNAYSGFTVPAGSSAPVPIDPNLLSSGGTLPIQAKVEEQETIMPAAVVNMQKKRGASQVTMEQSDEEDDDNQDDQSDVEEERPTRKSNKRKTAASTSTGNRRVVAKKGTTPIATAAPANTSQSHPHALVPVPEWEDKLSKEEYDKLSSKEKRQMRNKISARNFRHRRKAHIDTLEDQIRDKDGIIDVLREEVGTLRSENVGLRADIEVLKKNWESIAAKISAAVPSQPSFIASPAPVASTSSLTPEEDDLYGSVSLPALSPPSSSASTNGDNETELSFDHHATTSHASTSTAPSTVSSSVPAARRSTRVPTPNLRKDLSSATGNSFWDSTSPFSNAFGGFGRSGGMDVHTTFVPDLHLGGPAAVLGEKTQNGMNHFGTNGHVQQQAQQAPRNMNPALNGLTAEQINALREQFVSTTPSTGINARARSMAGKDEDRSSSFFDNNPFLLLRNDNLQDYRGQLYSKLANNIAGIQASNSAIKAGNSPPDGMRPAYFTTPTASSSPSLTTTSSSSTVANKREEETHRQMQTIAVLAQKSLFEKLSTAFWDAFAGDQPTSKPIIGVKKEIDGKKVADVMTGKARLEVVQNEKSQHDGLEEMMEKLELRK